MVAEQNAPRYRSQRDVVLFLRALALARRAQFVRSTPLPEVVANMAGEGGRVNEAKRAQVAAGRACSRYGRWFGGLNSCLTRSLVAGALLCGSHEVVLHVGFRPGSDEVPVDGHAWLTVDGEKLDVADPVEVAEPYTGVLEIPYWVEKGSEG